LFNFIHLPFYFVHLPHKKTFWKTSRTYKSVFCFLLVDINVIDII